MGVKEKEKAKVKETGMMKTGKVNGKNQKVKVTGETGKTKKTVTSMVKVKAKVKAEKVKAAKVKAAKVKEVRKVAKEETTKTPSITSKKVLNTILKKEKVNGKEKDQKVKKVVKVKKVEKVEKVEKVKALRVMEKTPNTTLKEKVVEKVKVTGDPKKTGKEKTGDIKEEKEKNTTSKKKMMMIWDQDQKVKVVKAKEKAKVKETGMMKTGKVNGKNQKVKVTGETGKTKKTVTGRN